MKNMVLTVLGQKLLPTLLISPLSSSLSERIMTQLWLSSLMKWIWTMLKVMSVANLKKCQTMNICGTMYASPREFQQLANVNRPCTAADYVQFRAIYEYLG